MPIQFTGQPAISPQILPPENLNPSLTDTFRSQWGSLISPIASQLNFYTSDSGFNPAISTQVEDYIQRKGLGKDDANYLRSFGIGSEENFAYAVSFINSRRYNKEVITNSSGLALFVTDPTIGVSLALPFVGIAAATATLRATSAASALIAAGDASVGARYLRAYYNAKGMNPAFGNTSLTILAAAEAAVVDGSVNLTQSLTNISNGEDPVLSLQNAIITTAASTLIGGALGYGLGALAGKPMNLTARMQLINKNYPEYLKQIDAVPAQGEDVSFAGKWFTNSVFMKMVPTAVRDTISDKFLPDWAKLDMLGLSGDNAMPLAGNKIGQSIPPSVHAYAMQRKGDWFKALDVIDTSYRNVNPTGATTVMNVPVGGYIENIRRRLGKSVITPEDWYNHVGRLYIDEVPFDQMTPDEVASTQALKSFFDKYGSELEDVGLINKRTIFEEQYTSEAGHQFELIDLTNSIIRQNREWMTKQMDDLAKQYEGKNNKLEKLLREQNARGLNEKQLAFRDSLNDDIAKIQSQMDYFDNLFNKIESARNIDELAGLHWELDLTPKMDSALYKLQEAMRATSKRIDNALEILDRGKGKEGVANYFPRFWNRQAIMENREAFKAILIKWFRENNTILKKDEKGLFKEIELSTRPEDLSMRADEAIDNILGETDDDAIDAIFNGVGRTGPLLSRRLDIPNNLVKDFIVTDAKDVMIAYTHRVGSRLEYHKRFTNPKTGKIMSLSEKLDDMRTQLLAEGVPEKSVNKFIKNFKGAYDIIVGSSVKRIDAIDTKVAEVLRTATTWTFLRTSGIAALGDASAILMDHELSTIGKTFMGLLDDISLKQSAREVKLSGEILEITAGTSHLRWMESLSRNIFNKSTADRVSNVFHTMSGLSVVTVAMKSLEGLVRGHTIIDMVHKMVDGKASDFEKTFLAQYSITPDMAQKIVNQPFEKSRNGTYLPNTEAWTDEDAVKAFRHALRSGVANRIIMGTPADKPFSMHGFTYIPDHIAKLLPVELPVDPLVKGYRRVESGLIALPFTFYSYTLGALTKITGNYASGAVRNKLAHTAVAIGLGAMIVKMRTPSWAWDNMDTEDKIARAFDFSGLAALYSDLGYRAISMVNELGFENPFPIEPKFQSEPNPLAAILSLGGAPVDWTYNVTSSVGDMLRGDFKDGAVGLIKMMPLIDVLATGGIIKDTALDIARQLPNRQ